MKNKNIDRILGSASVKVHRNVDSYFNKTLTGYSDKFNYYFDLTSFTVGIGFCKTTGISGWKYMFSLELGFFSVWIYFAKIT